MRAFVQHRYGSADRLELTEIGTPVPGDGDVLIRVRATSVNPYDWHLMRGEPRIARLMPGGLGLSRPQVSILGADIAGTVEAVGPGVTTWRAGDEVIAFLSGGGFGEFVTVPQEELIGKPANLSFTQAAAIPLAGVTAAVALRSGSVQAGQRVLVNGASGGVGIFAVQLARIAGAQVTGVCGARNADLVRSLGAGEVIDYRERDFTRTGRMFDLLIDIAGTKPLSACKRIITPDGAFVAVGGPAGRWVQPMGHVMGAMIAGRFDKRRVTLADVTRKTDAPAELGRLVALAAAGELVPVIDREYPFEQIPQAVSYQEQGHCAGKVVVVHG